MIKLWQQKTILNYALLPISWVWTYFTLRRLAKTGTCSRGVVICLGNITVGGTGKTPFTIYLAKKLLAQNLKVAIISSGYKSKVEGLLMLDLQKHDHTLVGDEPLLLATAAPTLISKDRKAGIEYLDSLGYQVILMDDGMQNPAAVKDYTILLFDSSCPLGNNMVIPAGPLREPLDLASKRVNLVVAVGKNNPSLAIAISKYELKYCEANFIPSISNSKPQKNQQYLAFAGIGNPLKFFNTLKDYGYNINIEKHFNDHYVYSNKDIEQLVSLAQKEQLRLITTSKDYVKIDAKYHHLIDNFAVELALENEDEQYLINAITHLLKYKRVI